MIVFVSIYRQDQLYDHDSGAKGYDTPRKSQGGTSDADSTIRMDDGAHEIPEKKFQSLPPLGSEDWGILITKRTKRRRRRRSTGMGHLVETRQTSLQNCKKWLMYEIIYLFNPHIKVLLTVWEAVRALYVTEEPLVYYWLRILWNFI